MEFVMICIFVTLGVVILSFIGLTAFTNSIIKEQEREIARLNSEKFKLQAALRKANRRKSPRIVEIHDSRIDPKNIPNFNDI